MLSGREVYFFPFLFPRFFKKAKGILQSPLSVCPLCYLLLNHWTNFNQIWCVSYSHELGVQQQIFFGPAPWGPGEGSKGQISCNFNYKVNFKDFYTKLCLCSHKWKIQNISDGIFILSPGSCPRGAGGAQGVKKNFIQTWSCGISNRQGWRAEQNASKIFILGSNWWPWGEVKRSNIIKFQLPCQFRRFVFQTLCVFSQMKDTKHIRQDFYSVALIMPQG